MYSNRDKLIKKKEEKATETEDEVAKALFELENAVKPEKQEEIKKIKLLRAQYLIEKDVKVLLIVVPYPLLGLVKKNYAGIIQSLETKFKCPVVIVAHRTIMSKYGDFFV